ncbi:MAG: hypothetical protein HY717_08590 [Planctomycetes bacterium]|nr:hypothetical protein [Planctomycetota bacterium]
MKKLITGLVLVGAVSTLLCVQIPYGPCWLSKQCNYKEKGAVSQIAAAPGCQREQAGASLAWALADDQTKKDGGGKKEESPAKEGPEKKGKPNPAAGGDRKADPQATGKITGEVVLKGKLPKLEPLKIKADHRDRAFCGAEVPNERLIVNDKKQVANAVVSLNIKPAAKAKPRELELTNDKCRFVPHVQATTVGSIIKISNKDEGVLHSAHAYLGAEFNIAISSSSKPVEKKLNRAGRVVIKCDTHEWMQADIQVFPHDFFAVTGVDGKFSLEGIPPGEYELMAWQEACEEVKQKIKVEAGKTAEIKVEVTAFED